MISTNLLVAPLNWGLGHATRCIPLINSLLKIEKNINVFVASDGRALALLKEEFKQLPVHFIELPSYNVVYPTNNNMTVAMIRQTPKLLRAIYSEYRAIQEIVKKFNINGIISDNRYGCFSDMSYSAFITHQFFLQTPPATRFLRPVLNGLNRFFIGRFDECWIPDFAHPIENLSAGLSHNIPANRPNIHYIAPLSRFADLPKTVYKKEHFLQKVYSIVVILSGPEPQRSIFDRKITKQLLNQSATALIVQGITEERSFRQLAPHVASISYLTSLEIAQVMATADQIITRAGYSTIMDLYAMGKKAILIPTPGQTEQEYLANELCRKGLYYSIEQDKFDLREALSQADNFGGIGKQQQPVNAFLPYLNEFVAKARCH